MPRPPLTQIARLAPLFGGVGLIVTLGIAGATGARLARGLFLAVGVDRRGQRAVVDGGIAALIAVIVILPGAGTAGALRLFIVIAAVVVIAVLPGIARPAIAALLTVIITVLIIAVIVIIAAVVAIVAIIAIIIVVAVIAIVASLPAAIIVRIIAALTALIAFGLFVLARLKIGLHPEIMVGELMIIFSLHAVAIHLRIGRKLLILVEHLRGIAPRPIVDAILMVDTTTTLLAAIVASAATAVCLTIVHVISLTFRSGRNEARTYPSLSLTMAPVFTRAYGPIAVSRIDLPIFKRPCAKGRAISDNRVETVSPRRRTAPDGPEIGTETIMSYTVAG